MIVVNRNGLTEAQKQKVLQPYARNSGAAVDFKAATEQAEVFFRENPDLLKDVGELLNTAP